MRYIPHTTEDIEEMLAVIGVSSVAELFRPIPKSLQLTRPMELPAPVPECRLLYHLEQMAAENRDTTSVSSFAGGGIYNHFVPAAVSQMLLRSEFYTAYTPYQPEVSQGTLQSIFEYQTMISRLLGMEVSNASLYDGSTAVAEAVGMSLRVFRNKRPKVLLCGAIHPEYTAVTRTHLTAPDDTLETVSYGQDGRIDFAALEDRLTAEVAAVIVQSPNFFGLIEDLPRVRALTDDHGVLLVVAFSEPIAYGLLKPPGAFDADIVVGEGQSLGMPVSYGGPLLGIMTARKKYVRSMPGRLVGKTSDRHGNDCFVITLATREQHIRREKATSNICTNEGLCALGAGIYMSLLGNQGLDKLALLNHHAARTLAEKLSSLNGISLPHAGTPFFNEFVVELPCDATSVCDQLAARGIIPGVPLGQFMPHHSNWLLVAATELNSLDQMNSLCTELRDIIG